MLSRTDNSAAKYLARPRGTQAVCLIAWVSSWYVWGLKCPRVSWLHRSMLNHRLHRIQRLLTSVRTFLFALCNLTYLYETCSCEFTGLNYQIQRKWDSNARKLRAFALYCTAKEFCDTSSRIFLSLTLTLPMTKEDGTCKK